MENQRQLIMNWYSSCCILSGNNHYTIHNNNPGNQPDSFKDFLKVIIAADEPKLEGEPHANALGSHNGIWDFYVTKKFKKRCKIILSTLF